jgi:beta-lactamase class D
VAEEAVGTLFIRRLGDGQEWVHDPVRADTPLLPASTFKIANAAIALETGVVTGADELFPWDGEERDLAAWNRDLTLGEAMAASAVPVYQEVARRVGSERMAEWLQRLDYGNADIGGGLERFWLDGALRISAREQVAFLERLVTGDLPLSQRTLDELTAMLRLDGGEGWTLHGKTGWASAVDLGWWVGWTVHGGDRYIFALNMDMARMEDASKRISIARRALAEVGALPGVAAP